LVDAVIVDTSPSSSKTEDSAADEVGDDMIGATRWQKKAAREKKKARRAGQKPVGDEIEVGNGSGDKEKEEKQLSRAERRKLIKDQILADGDGEDFKGYRRRMW
jgi:Mrp family chromosome partitioning ATPase